MENLVEEMAEQIVKLNEENRRKNERRLADVASRAKGGAKLKKLIFLRNGVEGDDILHISLLLGISVYNVDRDIRLMGYNQLVDKLSSNAFLNEFNKKDYDYIATACPSLLCAHDYKYDPLWWNENEHKWEIYFVEKGELKNIQEYTDKELRMAHNIEKLYLSGGLDNE